MTRDPMRADDIPVTRKMLDEMTESLRSETRSVDRRMDSRIIQVVAKIDSLEKKVDSKFLLVDAKIDSLEKKMDSKFLQIDAKIELVLAAVHRNSAIVEEQNARNQYVLDAWAALHDAQERQKLRLTKLEKHAFGIEQE